MSDQDVTRAFAHPEQRAAALSGPNPPDRLLLRDFIASADIGAFQVERGQDQRLRFNVAVELLPQAAAKDDVDLILSYDRLTEAIVVELSTERLNLLETLAERIAARILHEPQADTVFLRVEKLDRGPYALGVEIVRRKSDIAASDLAGNVAQPVVHLLDTHGPVPSIAGDGRPLVLIVAPADLQTQPQGATDEARLRIGLLAIEQAAWAFASQDHALAVAATRTEIDWSVRQGKPIVWAPSKLVLDTPGAPLTSDIGALAIWLAESLDAGELVVHGDVAIPAGCRVPVRRA